MSMKPLGIVFITFQPWKNIIVFVYSLKFSYAYKIYFAHTYPQLLPPNFMSLNLLSPTHASLVKP